MMKLSVGIMPAPTIKAGWVVFSVKNREYIEPHLTEDGGSGGS